MRGRADVAFATPGDRPAQRRLVRDLDQAARRIRRDTALRRQRDKAPTYVVPFICRERRQQRDVHAQAFGHLHQGIEVAGQRAAIGAGPGVHRDGQEVLVRDEVGEEALPPLPDRAQERERGAERLDAAAGRGRRDAKEPRRDAARIQPECWPADPRPRIGDEPQAHARRLRQQAVDVARAGEVVHPRRGAVIMPGEGHEHGVAPRHPHPRQHGPPQVGVRQAEIVQRPRLDQGRDAVNVQTVGGVVGDVHQCRRVSN